MITNSNIKLKTTARDRQDAMVCDDWAKTVVVFGGARDHYQVALALQEAGWLSCLVSELYLPAMPRVLQVFIALLDRTGRRCSRSNEALPGDYVRISWLAFAASIANRIYPHATFVRWKDAALGRACGRIAMRGKNPVLAYSYYASYAFEHMSRTRARAVFQVHPHPVAVRAILQEELRLCPFAAESLLQENEMKFPAKELARLSDEALQADLVLTPSSYAKSTLVQAGVQIDRIRVVPYGIDTSVFTRKKFRRERGPLRLIFVGSLVQRKGLSYLFEAIRGLKAGKQVELVLAGRGMRDDGLLRRYADVPFRVLWGAPREQLVAELQAADLFVFPSLVESFAHVILEAMAVGLPILTTRHTAGPDLVEDGRMGFIGPIRNPEFLIEKIQWFLDNRDALAEMGLACQAEAERRTWERFRRETREALS